MYLLHFVFVRKHPNYFLQNACYAGKMFRMNRIEFGIWIYWWIIWYVSQQHMKHIPTYEKILEDTKRIIIMHMLPKSSTNQKYARSIEQLFLKMMEQSAITILKHSIWMAYLVQLNGEGYLLKFVSDHSRGNLLLKLWSNPFCSPLSKYQHQNAAKTTPIIRSNEHNCALMCAILAKFFEWIGVSLGFGYGSYDWVYPNNKHQN